MNRPFLSTDRDLDIRVIGYSGWHYLPGVKEYYEQHGVVTGDGFYDCLNGDDVISYSISTSLSDKGITLGDVVSTNFSLEITKESYLKGIDDYFDSTGTGGNCERYFAPGSSVSVLILKYKDQLDSSGNKVLDACSCFGAWRVTDVSMDEYSPVVTVNGVDLLQQLLDRTIKDKSTYTSSTTWEETFKRVCYGTWEDYDLVGNDPFLLREYPVFGGQSPTTGDYSMRRPWWTRPTEQSGLTPAEMNLYTSTFRGMLSTIAKMSFGFVFVDLSGRLQIHSFSNENRYPAVISEPLMFSFTDSGLKTRYYFTEYSYVSDYTFSGGKFTSISWKKNCAVSSDAEEDEAESWVIDEDEGETKRGMLSIADEFLPIKGSYPYKSVLRNVYSDLGTISSGGIEFVGDPEIQLGDIVYASKTYDTTIRSASSLDMSLDTSFALMATSINYTFDGCLRCTIRSDLRSDDEAWTNIQGVNKDNGVIEDESDMEDYFGSSTTSRTW